MRTRVTERAISRGKGANVEGVGGRLGGGRKRVKRGGDSRGRKTGLSGRPSVRVREGESEGATARAAERVQQQAAVRGCSTAGPQTKPDKWAERAGEQRPKERCAAPISPTEASQCQCQWPSAIVGPDGQWEATGRLRVPLGLLVAGSEGPGGCSGACCHAGLLAWRRACREQRSADRTSPARPRGRSRRTTYLPLTYLGTKENETPFAAPVYSWAW